MLLEMSAVQQYAKAKYLGKNLKDTCVTIWFRRRINNLVALVLILVIIALGIQATAQSKETWNELEIHFSISLKQERVQNRTLCSFRITEGFNHMNNQN